MFIGYTKDVKGFILWCIKEGRNKTIISRDVVFNEHHFPLLKSKENNINKIENSFKGFEWQA